VQQILAAVFDYHSIAEKRTQKRMYTPVPYKGYYTSISHGGKFFKKFLANEGREFWLDLNPSFDFEVLNVCCKLPSTQLEVIHKFRLSEITANSNLCMLYEMRSVVLRKEYPISNLYRWIIDEIEKYMNPMILKCLYDSELFISDIDKIIVSYVFS
jgi:hypothetical protein